MSATWVWRLSWRKNGIGQGGKSWSHFWGILVILLIATTVKTDYHHPFLSLHSFPFFFFFFSFSPTYSKHTMVSLTASPKQDNSFPVPVTETVSGHLVTTKLHCVKVTGGKIGTQIHRENATRKHKQKLQQSIHRPRNVRNCWQAQETRRDAGQMSHWESRSKTLWFQIVGSWIVRKHTCII